MVRKRLTVKKEKLDESIYGVKNIDFDKKLRVLDRRVTSDEFKISDRVVDIITNDTLYDMASKKGASKMTNEIMK